MMEADSRPGSPLKIYLGGNYAQPSDGYDASWCVNEVGRITTYLGNRNCGAPWSSDEERKAENSPEAGKKPDAFAAEKLIVQRAYAVRDTQSVTFNLGSSYT
jgi:hypothetical protein